MNGAGINRAVGYSYWGKFASFRPSCLGLLREQYFTDIERAWTVDCPRSDVLLLLRLLGREIVCYCYDSCHVAFAP